MKKVLLLLLGLGSVGCVTVERSVLLANLPAVPLEEVQLFLPGDPVPDHERVAILEAEFYDGFNSSTDALTKLREEAAELGGNGVVIVGSDSESTGVRALRTLATGMYLGGLEKTQAIVIRITGAVLPQGGDPRIELVSQGTGVLLARRGVIVSNYHVAGDAARVEVRHESGDWMEASVLRSDRANDLVVIGVPDGLQEGNEYRSLSIRDSDDVEVGENVYAAGYPSSDVFGQTMRITDGTVSAKVGLADDYRLLQVTTPVQPGNSGGPLLDQSGRLVGIVVSSVNSQLFMELKGAMPQNANFAIKTEYLGGLLSGFEEEPVGVVFEDTVPMQATDIAQRAREFTVQIRASG
jgi:S1-C subfamily serine protease